MSVIGRTALRFIRACRRGMSRLTPLRPMPGTQALLDAEYRSGVWDYLNGLDELSRFSVIAGYCHFLAPGGSILEVGCGAGTLQSRLDAAKYTRYVGIDISTVAIRRAKERENGQATFVASDAATYAPAAPFDLIVFNESLEYFADPVSLVARYDPFLTAGGRHIVSMFVGLDTARTARIWRALQRRYRVETQTRVANGAGFIWIIKVLRPR